MAAARRGERVALGTATDPYQPGESELGVTRRFLECAAELRGLRLGITTKGAIVLRDLDLLARIHRHSQLSVQLSLNSTDAELLRRIEPWAPPPAVRLEVLRRLVAAGLRVGLSLSPILPGLTDQEESLDALMGRAAAAGVRRIWGSLLFLRSPTRETYFAFLAREFPRYLEAYRRAYAGTSTLKGRYRARVEELVRRLREKHGLLREDAETASAYARVPEQLDLFRRSGGPAPARQLRLPAAVLTGGSAPHTPWRRGRNADQYTWSEASSGMRAASAPSARRAGSKRQSGSAASSAAWWARSIDAFTTWR